ncbi:MAG TPA: hypothetical protein VGN32_01040 [Ktedonobacterales bacterium]|nr:hypothetical protein [Ktedonobacterales bacterium]
MACPTCGSWTSSERQPCLACQRTTADAPRLTFASTFNLGATAPRVSLSKPTAIASRSSYHESSRSLRSAANDPEMESTPGAAATEEYQATDTSASDSPPTNEHPPTPAWRRPDPRRSLAAMGVLLVLLVSVALLTGPSHPTTTAMSPTLAVATRTPLPTATASGTPLPTAMPGFTVFVDPTAGFWLQYPSTWQEQKNDAGVQVFDNPTANSYVLQVYHEDPNNCPAVDPKTAAACWVDFYLSQWQQQEQIQNYVRLTGPTAPAMFGAQIWQTGVATFGPADTPDRIQVYATVYQGQPYIIEVAAPADLFAAGDQLYFRPMLATFQFLPPDAS